MALSEQRKEELAAQARFRGATGGTAAGGLVLALVLFGSYGIGAIVRGLKK